MASSTQRSKRPGGDACSAISCHNARYRNECDGMSFFRFPSDESRCRVWVQNSRRDDLRGRPAKELNKGGYFLRSQHFEANQFTVPQERKRLNWNAVPTLFDVPNPPPKLTLTRPGRKERNCAEPPHKKKKLCIQTDGEICTPDSLPLEEPTPQTTGPTQQADSDTVAALKSKLKVVRNRLYKLQRRYKKSRQQRKQLSASQREAAVIADVKQFLPEKAVTFTKTQLRAVGKKQKGLRWTEEDKAIAMSLFHASPKAYRKLKQIFVLPSVRTLRRALESLCR